MFLAPLYFRAIFSNVLCAVRCSHYFLTTVVYNSRLWNRSIWQVRDQWLSSMNRSPNPRRYHWEIRMSAGLASCSSRKTRWSLLGPQANTCTMRGATSIWIVSTMSATWDIVIHTWFRLVRSKWPYWTRTVGKYLNHSCARGRRGIPPDGLFMPP